MWFEICRRTTVLLVRHRQPIDVAIHKQNVWKQWKLMNSLSINEDKTASPADGGCVGWHERESYTPLPPKSHGDRLTDSSPALSRETSYRQRLADRRQRQPHTTESTWRANLLSPVHTVAEKWDCRRIRRQWPFSATVSLFCDSVDRALGYVPVMSIHMWHVN